MKEPVLGQNSIGKTAHGEALGQQGASREAAPYKNSSPRILAEHMPPPDTYAELRALNEKAEELFRQGRLEECVEACEEGLKALPENLSFQFLRGRALMGLDRLGEAEESFSKVRESHPDEPHGFHGLMLVYNRQMLWEKVVETGMALRKKHPGRLDSMNLLGLALIQLSRLGEAEEVFAGIRETHPDEPHGYHGLLVVYNQRKLWDKGTEAGLALRERYPDRPDSMYLLGLALMELSRFEEAEEVFSGIRESHGDMLYGHLGLAMVHYRRYKWERCVEASTRALELEPDRLDMVILKTRSLMKLCRFEEAKELMEGFFKKMGMNRIPALSLHSRTLHPCLNEDLLNQYWRVVLLGGEMERAVSIQQEVMHNIIEGELMDALYGPYSVLIPFFDNSVLGL